MVSAEETGQLRIKFADTTESNPIPVATLQTAVYSGGAKTYPTGETLKAMPALGQAMIKSLMVKGRVVFYFVSDATDIVESEESEMHIPIVVYEDNNGRAGQVLEKKMLTFQTATGFTAAGTVDVSCTAKVERRIAYQDVPRGQIWALDPAGKPHIYFGDDTA